MNNSLIFHRSGQEFRQQTVLLFMMIVVFVAGCVPSLQSSSQASESFSPSKKRAEKTEGNSSRIGKPATQESSASVEKTNRAVVADYSDETPKIVKVAFKSNSGRQKAVIQVETVSKPEELSRGLMYRKSLGENNGMLFLMGRKKILSFWMKNTYIPLSIAYINDDMRIVDIHKMRPLNEDIHYLSSEPCRYAVEVNQGWFRKNKIRKSDVVEFLFQ